MGSVTIRSHVRSGCESCENFPESFVGSILGRQKGAESRSDQYCHGAHRTIVGAMAKLVFSTIASLDGYIADEGGNFDWAAPDPEVFEFIGDLERSTGTVLYGRRMYETMVYWETFRGGESAPAYLQDFADTWRAQEKIVYSTTLETPSSARTKIERVFVPDDVQRLKDSSEKDLAIGGAHLASQAIEAGLVDEMYLFVMPITVGGGTPAHPGDAHQGLVLRDVRQFESGVVYLRYEFSR
jgi:dihydrofolate reductase